MESWSGSTNSDQTLKMPTYLQAYCLTHLCSSYDGIVLLIADKYLHDENKQKQHHSKMNLDSLATYHTYR